MRSVIAPGASCDAPPLRGGTVAPYAAAPIAVERCRVPPMCTALAGAIGWRRSNGSHKVPRRAGMKFKVNKQYRGARSYGTISQEELEEAARIRNEYNQDLSSVKKADARPKARRRLLLKRLRPSFQAQPQEDEGEEGETEEEDESSAGSNEDADADGADWLSETKNSSSSWSAAGGDVSSLTFRTSWEGWPPPMDLAAAKSLAATVTKPGSSRVSGLALQAAARALYEIKDFVGSALLLRELRDFGVDLEVLERRLEVVKAQNLFDQVAVRLGVAYLDAGLWRDAWEALMGACAQPRLSRPLATIAVAALADAAERGANASEALQQVELLQGLLDAEAVLRALPRDRREGLEIYMALSLEKIGRKKESRQLLTRLAQQGTSTRRKQAEWALLVQDAEVSDNAEGREMRRIWEEAPSPILPSASASRGAGAAKMMSKEARSGRSALDEAAPVATLLLVLDRGGWQVDGLIS